MYIAQTYKNMEDIWLNPQHCDASYVLDVSDSIYQDFITSFKSHSHYEVTNFITEFKENIGF